MRKLLSLLLGLALGAAVGVVIVTLFSPVSGQEFRANMRDHIDQSWQAARAASENKRRELERELQQMRNS